VSNRALGRPSVKSSGTISITLMATQLKINDVVVAKAHRVRCCLNSSRLSENMALDTITFPRPNPHEAGPRLQGDLSV